MSVSAYALTSLASLKSYLGITASTDNTILEQSIDHASGMIEAYCGRKFVLRRYQEIREIGVTGNRLHLRQWPVSAVYGVRFGWSTVITVQGDTTDIASSVTVQADAVNTFRTASDGTETATQLAFTTYNTTAEMAVAIDALAGFTAVSAINVPSIYLRKSAGHNLLVTSCPLYAPTEQVSEYEIDHDRGILHGVRGTGFKSTLLDYSFGYNTTLIDYSAGYLTVPDAVHQAVLVIASRIYRDRLRDGGVQSESLGGYSYSLKPTAERIAEMDFMLSLWKSYR